MYADNKGNIVKCRAAVSNGVSAVNCSADTGISKHFHEQTHPLAWMSIQMSQLLYNNE